MTLFKNYPENKGGENMGNRPKPRNCSLHLVGFLIETTNATDAWSMWIVVDGSASTNRQAGRDGLVAAKQLAKEIIVRFTSGIRGTTCRRVNLKPNSARSDHPATKKTKTSHFIFVRSCDLVWIFENALCC